METIRRGIKIALPASKSIVNRALIIEKLSGKSFINKKDISCDDTKVLSQVLSKITLLQCTQRFFAKNANKILRSLRVFCALCGKNNNVIDIKNSGTAMRFMTAFLTQKVGNWLLIGSKSMQTRPIDTLVNALRTLGADIEYCEEIGFLPIKICTKTPLNPQNIELTIENSNSSQTISALMLIAPNFTNGLKINIKNCASFPYILLTKKIMEDCGAEVQINDNQIVVSNRSFRLKGEISCKQKQISPFGRNDCLVESDWDAAAFWYAFLATNEKTQKITLTNLFPNSYQPDSIVKDIFEKFGIKSLFEKISPQITQINTNNNSFKIQNNENIICENLCNLRTLTLQKTENFVLPQNFDFDFSNYPDLVPIMAVTCCVLGIKFNFSSVQHLRIKESNRLDALQSELQKCGFLLTQNENSLQWFGEKCVPEKLPKIETCNDHRIAMSFAILKQKIDIEILNPNVVTKSYKNFWRDFEKVINPKIIFGKRQKNNHYL